ncbi:hypothetical protein CERSUDRAFT_113625 [Gelatoporia subvermispora B]|uniref:Uncharacterized protein n=1 Tax=Ceriporiopsis subvermispora (strain B) TaxID=914234 RepID=M2QN70_CERS8|nr:hypothetical protein CERSUDRAFT_113625 [Gelatoporia subvermispora B]
MCYPCLLTAHAKLQRLWSFIRNSDSSAVASRTSLSTLSVMAAKCTHLSNKGAMPTIYLRQSSSETDLGAMDL